LAGGRGTASDGLQGYEHDFGAPPDVPGPHALRGYQDLAGEEYEQWYPIWRRIAGRPLLCRAAVCRRPALATRLSGPCWRGIRAVVPHLAQHRRSAAALARAAWAARVAGRGGCRCGRTCTTLSPQ